MEGTQMHLAPPDPERAQVERWLAMSPQERRWALEEHQREADRKRLEVGRALAEVQRRERLRLQPPGCAPTKEAMRRGKTLARQVRQRLGYDPAYVDQLTPAEKNELETLPYEAGRPVLAKGMLKENERRTKLNREREQRAKLNETTNMAIAVARALQRH